MSKQKILIQLDTDAKASVFDAVVAIDSGVEKLLQYSGIRPEDVRGLVHGAMYTRGPSDLVNTAIFVGGSNVSDGEAIAAIARESLFDPFRVSIMLDSNGANSTAAAAVLCAAKHFSLENSTSLVMAATGAVGQRVCRLLGNAGSKVMVASRSLERSRECVDRLVASGVPADRLVKIPGELDFDHAASAMLQGMTAHYLSHSTYPIKQGETALVHAAAGGVGALLVQMAKYLGARLIGTTGSEEKAQLARNDGADDVIIYTKQDFEAETRRLTGGKGVHVVYDGVGKTTFDKDLNVLRPRGYLVLFGASSGAVPPFDLIKLSQKGSLFLTRPSLHHYIATREELEQRATDVLQMIVRGDLKLRIHKTFPLAEAETAHRELEGRKTMGKLLLIP